jgi:hypothetical protein
VDILGSADRLPTAHNDKTLGHDQNSLIACAGICHTNQRRLAEYSLYSQAVPQKSRAPTSKCLGAASHRCSLPWAHAVGAGLSIAGLTLDSLACDGPALSLLSGPEFSCHRRAFPVLTTAPSRPGYCSHQSYFAFQRLLLYARGTPDRARVAQASPLFGTRLPVPGLRVSRALSGDQLNRRATASKCAAALRIDVSANPGCRGSV